MSRGTLYVELWLGIDVNTLQLPQDQITLTSQLRRKVLLLVLAYIQENLIVAG